jgi:S1-C subfamily serine protease
VQNMGLTELPRCGGYAGFQVQGIWTCARGLKLIAIGAAGTTAQGLGLRPGDVVVVVQGHALESSEFLDASLRGVSPGSPLVVDVVRDGTRWSFQGVARDVPYDGTGARAGTVLGAPLELAPVGASFVGGVVDSSVEPAGPAGRAGLQRGDVIQSVAGIPMVSPDVLDLALRLRSFRSRRTQRAAAAGIRTKQMTPRPRARRSRRTTGELRLGLAGQSLSQGPSPRAGGRLHDAAAARLAA